MEQQILSLSLKDYKKQIDELRASLLGLEKGSEQYEKTVKDIKQQQQSLNEVMAIGKRDTDALDGSYNALQQQMTALKKEWKATNDEARRNELSVQITEIDTKLKDLDASVGQFQRNVGNYAIAGESMKSQLKSLKEEIAQLSAQGIEPTDERMQQLIQTAGKMQDAMSDANAMIKQAADDTSNISKVIDVAKTGTAVFGVWQGAMASLGMENNKVVQSIQQLQGVLTMLNSLQTIQTALVDKASATYQLWNKALQAVGLSSKATAADTTALTTATVAETTATKGATVATNLFKKALISTGIGAVVVLIGALIANLDTLTGWFRELIGTSEDYSKVNEEVEASIEEVNHQTNNEVKIMQAQGKTESDIIKYKQKKTKAQIKEIEAKIADIKATAEQEKRAKTWKTVIIGVMKAVSTATKAWLNPLLYVFDKIFKTDYRTTFNNLVNKGVNSISESIRNVGNTSDESKKAIEDLTKTLNKTKGALNDLNVDLEVATIKENKKTESTKQGNKATQDSTKYINERAEALKKNLEATKESIKYATDLAKAQGKMPKTKEKERELFMLSTEINYWKEIGKLYKEDVEKFEDGTEEKKEALKAYLDALNKLLQLNREITIKNAQEESDARDREFEKEIKRYEDRKKLFRDLTYEYEQIAAGSVPVINSYKMKLDGEFDKMQEYLSDKITLLNHEIHVALEKDLGKFPITNDELAKQYKEYLERQEKTILEEWSTFPREGKKPDLSIDLDMALLDKQFEEQNEVYNKAIAGFKERLATLIQGTEEYEKTEQELGQAMMEQERLKTDYIIDQQNLLNEKRQSDIKANKEYVKRVLADTQALANGLGNLFGGIADIMKDNIQKKLDNGKISEEMANEEFERVKKVQLAQLWISTLAGAAGAFVNDMGSYSFPFNAIIAAIDMATTLTTGIMQHRQIAAQTMDSASSGGGGTGTGVPEVQDIQVAPLLNEQLDSQSLTALNTEAMAANQGSQKVYILQSDLEDSGRQVEIRQSQTTF